MILSFRSYLVLSFSLAFIRLQDLSQYGVAPPIHVEAVEAHSAINTAVSQ